MKRATLTVALFLATAAAIPAAHPAQAADMKLWRLDCGTIQVNDLSLFSDDFDYVGKKRKLTDSCYLIQHGADYMVWDTGLPAGLLNAPFNNDPMSPTLGHTLLEQFATIGVKPDQVALVGISHYHFDHVGQAADFPKAKLLIGRADLEAVKSEPVPFGAAPDLLAPWLKNGGAVDPVTGDKDVYGDGSVVMLSMPGHTPGSYALLLRLKHKGAVVLSGDVVHFEGQFKTGDVPGFNTDRAQSLASMSRLQNLVKKLKAILVVQHDPDDIAKLPAFPNSTD